MNEEQFLYNNKDIKVSNARVIIGNTTYSMANITSVSFKKKPANKATDLVVISVSIFMILCGILQIRKNWEMLIAGIILGTVGIVSYRGAKDKYIVILGSSSGEKNALESTDKDFIQQIVNAINNAMVKSG